MKYQSNNTAITERASVITSESGIGVRVAMDSFILGVMGYSFEMLAGHGIVGPRHTGPGCPRAIDQEADSSSSSSGSGMISCAILRGIRAATFLASRNGSDGGAGRPGSFTTWSAIVVING